MGLLQRRSRRSHDVPAEGRLAPGVELEQLRVETTRLRNEVDRLQQALDALPLGIVLVERGGLVRTRNEAARRFRGVAHGDVLVLEAVDTQIQRALQGVEARASVELFGPPLKVIDVHAMPLQDGGALVVIDDVSERIRLDAVRTDFVANISHELKTPVGALAVLAETMIDEDDLDVLHRLATKAMNEALRAATSIDDLLELSRIELGGAVARDPVGVEDMLREVIERTAARAEQQRIELVLEPVATGLTALGDRRQLVSAIGNLADNAVKYSEPGGQVHLSANVDGDRVVFVVRDRGIGIPARDLDRIFERFYRVDRARSRDTGGTGLGLAIVRHVATNHEGDVRVQSVEGEGSTFTMRIPAVLR